MTLKAVITTIAPPTPCMAQLADRLESVAGELIVIGDAKGPTDYALPGSAFFSLARQRDLPYALARDLPIGHYSRKNLGYLIAVQGGASCIYETDDDNGPNEFWAPRAEAIEACKVVCQGWVNAFRYYALGRMIWPRGFPLRRIREPLSTSLGELPVGRENCPVQQSLHDSAPDVDAIWRLLDDSEFHFQRGRSLWLGPGAWCPFNSQSTWWWPVAYPLLYLPSHCTFRMTDIWRSFVAQRCLWALGLGIAYHPPEVVQQRNPHDYMLDFAQEIPGYLHNEAMAARLAELTLPGGAGNVCRNLRCCYEALVEHSFFPEQELNLLDAWLRDLAETRAARRWAA